MNMQIWRKQLTGLSLAMIFGAVSLSALAQTAALPTGVFATVNGEPLSDALLDVNVVANVTQGRADTPQLRDVIKNELVGREVLAQEAQKLKLDQTGQAQAQMAQLQQNFLANLLLNHYNSSVPTFFIGERAV
jgi:peptidyl-prolyl cis-trans isomerase C